MLKIPVIKTKKTFENIVGEKEKNALTSINVPFVLWCLNPFQR